MSYGPALRSAWQLARGSLMPLLAAVFIVAVPAVLAGVVSGLLFPDVPGVLLVLAAGLLGVAFTAPLLGGLNGLALARARGREVEAGMVLRGRRFGTRMLSYGLVLVFLALLPEVFGLPAQLLMLLGQVLTIFTPLLIVDQDLPAGQALAQSMKLVVFMPGTMLLWLLTSLGIGIAVVLTFGIGMIWLVPFSLVLTATIYDRATARA